MPNNEGPQIGYFAAYAMFWRRYADFTGRTSVAAFWKAYLFALIVQIGQFAVSMYAVSQFFSEHMDDLLRAAMSGASPYAISSGMVVGSVGITVFQIYYYATLIPTIAIMVRRLRDSGQSPWWTIAFLLIPVAGFFMAYVMLRRPSLPPGWTYMPLPPPTPQTPPPAPNPYDKGGRTAAGWCLGLFLALLVTAIVCMSVLVTNIMQAAIREVLGGDGYTYGDDYGLLPTPVPNPTPVPEPYPIPDSAGSGDWEDDLSADELAVVNEVREGFANGVDEYSVEDVLETRAEGLRWSVYTLDHRVYYVYAEGTTKDGGDVFYAEFERDGDGVITVYNLVEGVFSVYNEEAAALYEEWASAVLRGAANFSGF
ncbi:MAG: DUF805 domain-containing protein [Clostridiales Family XIII bacterium]|jgi:uncharacterized membrane protein YhaH (DUF805 family)|nr:DUF805 domain-containing protein [Clostridiales Family XIII bacterium]